MAELARPLFPEDVLLMDQQGAVIAALQFAEEAWSNTGTDGVYIWGDVHYSQTHYHAAQATPATLHVAVNLVLMNMSKSAWFCSCGQRMPCMHASALLLLWARSNESFPPGTPPAFVPAIRISPTPAHEQMLTSMQEGANALERWITDLIREGLAQPHVRTGVFWDTIADRMLAARMPVLGEWLREAAKIPARGGDWVEPLLHELGKMMLLVRSVQRFEQLPVDIRGDVRNATGWAFSLSDPQLDTGTRDQWLVLGTHKKLLRDGTPESSVWLYGSRSRRMALLHSIGMDMVAHTRPLATGMLVDAALVYTPSRTPLHALLIRINEVLPPKPIQGMHITEAINSYSSALAGNPLLRQYPMLLESVVAIRFNKGWILRHEDGTYLPIALEFPHRWALHGIHGGNPANVAGLWDGQAFTPLSVFDGDKTIDFARVPEHKRIKVGKNSMQEVVP
jgi:hypothetical protein